MSNNKYFDCLDVQVQKWLTSKAEFECANCRITFKPKKGKHAVFNVFHDPRVLCDRCSQDMNDAFFGEGAYREREETDW